MRIFCNNWDIKIVDGMNYWFNSTSVAKILRDKIRTNQILQEDWYSIPEYTILQKKNNKFENNRNDLQNALLFIKKVGFPVIVKPNNWENGEWVFVLHDMQELYDFYEQYNNGIFKDENSIAIIQKFIQGDEIRVIYLDWEILVAYKKHKLKIIGNGVNTLFNFIENSKYTQEEMKSIVELIMKKWWTWNDILKKWESVEIYEYINSLSNQSEEINFNEKDIEFIKNIAQSFWANYFGIDIISNWDIHQWNIIEINGKPDILYARHISKTFHDIFFSKGIDLLTWESFKKSSEIENFFYNKRTNNNKTEYWLSKEEYRDKISSLKFLKNKNEILSSDHFIKNGIFILLDEFEKKWCSYWIDTYGFHATLELSDWENRLIYSGDYWFNSSVIRRIFEDKIYTSQILRNAWFKVANDMLVVKDTSNFSSETNGKNACFEFASKNKYPLIFKPNNWSLWVWVQKIFNSKQLLNALNQYNNNENSWLFLLQEYISWNDYRVIYLDWKILVAYRRIFPQIKGNWQNNIKELLSLNNYHQIEKQVKIYLESQNVSIENILQDGEILEILPTANIATMWQGEEIDFDEEDRKFIDRIAKTFWANYFGIDILSTGKLSEWIILEINNWPITTWIAKVSSSFKESFAKTIVERLVKKW